jgi:hypothetical protein
MNKVKMSTQPKYTLNADGRFVIENYNHAKPFSNFFPGIAGVWGIPMWVFYVNRGQCIASFGVESKDKAIMEFQPANKSYRLTSLQGFRTFIKAGLGTKTVYWEPFQNHLEGTAFKKQQALSMSAHDLTLTEVNADLGLAVEVNYFTLPEEPYSALVRRVTVRNLKKKARDIELVDGLPVINPYGLRDWAGKNMSRTIEAWITVENFKNKAPYYHLKVEAADTSQVTHIKEGNFFFSVQTDGPKARLLNPVIEAAKVFGPADDFAAPAAFLEKTFKYPAKQQFSNRTPAALSHARFTLAPQGRQEIVSLFGYIQDIDRLNHIVAQVGKSPEFILRKAARNQEIIEGIKNYAFTASASREFDLYAGHTFLDNILRGGLPVSLKTRQGNAAFNVYSRKHGDPERDYNYFTLSPTFYSQGNGNYRDVNQNRRNDVWFNTDVGDSHVVSFLNLVQADGYNPLVVKGTTFHVEQPEKIDDLLGRRVREDGRAALREFLRKSFAPGDLMQFIDTHGIALTVDVKTLLGEILELCARREMADHGEGFWADHWTYNLDLIESYLGLYPENLRILFLEKKEFSFYHNNHYVLPRAQRYVLTDAGVRQYHAVAQDGAHDKAKGHVLRADNGHGEVYRTHLLAKMLCLVANKAATLDPSGIGVEMEADKPNWYDALNGLPGLLGSSSSETFEIKRVCRFLLKAISDLSLDDGDHISLFEELAVFIEQLRETLRDHPDALEYWFRSNDLKEGYRAGVRYGITGREKQLSVGVIKDFLNLVIAKTGRGLDAAATDIKGKLATYFYHEVTEHRQRGQDSKHVMPVKFKRHALPSFLEGYVHASRATDTDGARRLYKEARGSGLFDKKLKMYRVNADISGEDEEIGRAHVFPAGWLENASVWLHMEYKFMLELLRGGLYEEFFLNFRDVMVPFQKPARYGRSVLENSSFLVSSLHEDTSLHGQGFVARLSGSTAEFLHMWLHMNTGGRPFSIVNGELTFQLKPILPRWLFSKKVVRAGYINSAGERQEVVLPANTYAFNFLNSVLVVYHNPRRRDTRKMKIKSVTLTYADKPRPVIIPSAVVPPPYAGEIREKKVRRIDAYFA